MFVFLSNMYRDPVHPSGVPGMDRHSGAIFLKSQTSETTISQCFKLRSHIKEADRYSYAWRWTKQLKVRE